MISRTTEYLTPIPHGKNGELVNLIVDKNRCDLIKQESATIPDVVLNDRQLCDFELLATGAYSPLKGFMTQADYESVLENMRLSTGELWLFQYALMCPKLW